MCLLLDTPVGAEVGGGITFVTFLEEHPKVHKTPHRCIYGFSGCYLWELYVLALVRQPSLRGYDACMVYSVKGGTPEELQANRI